MKQAKPKTATKKSSRKKAPKKITRCVFTFFDSIEQAAKEAPMPYDTKKSFVSYCLKTDGGQLLGSMEVRLDEKTKYITENSQEKMRSFAHNPNFMGFVKSMRIEDVYIEL